jgi:choline dehydrogenase-like flavoprotein
MRFDIDGDDAEKIHHGVRLLAELMFSVGARKVLLPFGGLPEIASPDELGKIDARKRVYHDVELMTVHIMSSCRMGADAARGPTDAYGRLHDVPNVVVADASVIPSSIGVNPMETIVALALRNADRWAETLGR